MTVKSWVVLYLVASQHILTTAFRISRRRRNGSQVMSENPGNGIFENEMATYLAVAQHSPSYSLLNQSQTYQNHTGVRLNNQSKDREHTGVQLKNQSKRIPHAALLGVAIGLAVIGIASHTKKQWLASYQMCGTMIEQVVTGEKWQKLGWTRYLTESFSSLGQVLHHLTFAANDTESVAQLECGNMLKKAELQMISFGLTRVLPDLGKAFQEDSPTHDAHADVGVGPFQEMMTGLPYEDKLRFAHQALKESRTRYLMVDLESALTADDFSEESIAEMATSHEPLLHLLHEIIMKSKESGDLLKAIHDIASQPLVDHLAAKTRAIVQLAAPLVIDQLQREETYEAFRIHVENVMNRLTSMLYFIQNMQETRCRYTEDCQNIWGGLTGNYYGFKCKTKFVVQVGALTQAVLPVTMYAFGWVIKIGILGAINMMDHVNELVPDTVKLLGIPDITLMLTRFMAWGAGATAYEKRCELMSCIYDETSDRCVVDSTTDIDPDQILKPNDLPALGQKCVIETTPVPAQYWPPWKYKRATTINSCKLVPCDDQAEKTGELHNCDWLKYNADFLSLLDKPLAELVPREEWRPMLMRYTIWSTKTNGRDCITANTITPGSKLHMSECISRPTAREESIWTDYYASKIEKEKEAHKKQEFVWDKVPQGNYTVPQGNYYTISPRSRLDLCWKSHAGNPIRLVTCIPNDQTMWFELDRGALRTMKRSRLLHGYRSNPLKPDEPMNVPPDSHATFMMRQEGKVFQSYPES